MIDSEAVLLVGELAAIAILPLTTFPYNVARGFSVSKSRQVIAT